ncbi:MAG: glycosyltransferase [Gemmatimonadales bacterium]|nr:glycosyltransferase [Gemmatimonadales bacterium]
MNAPPIRIFVATETYPNPYRPYLDAQLAQFVRDGHDLSILATQAWPVVNPVIEELGLVGRTRYFPQSLREAPRFAGRMIASAPRMLGRALTAAGAVTDTLRTRLSAFSKALVFPERAPDVLLVHDFWLLCTLPFLKELYPRAVVALYHHGGESSTMRVSSNARLAFELADVVFTNTRSSREEVLARGCGESKVRIVPVGFNLAEYTPSLPKSRRPGGVFRLLYAGRLVEEKGLQYALEALAIVRSRTTVSVSLTIMGNGPCRDDLEASAHRLGLTDSVHFLANQPSRKMIRAMDQFDALILPSVPTEQWRETQGCVVQEAMLMRLPVITTQNGGLPESIPPAMAPYSIPCRDAEALASAYERLLAMDDRHLDELGDAGRTFVLEYYDVRETNRALLGICAEVG